MSSNYAQTRPTSAPTRTEPPPPPNPSGLRVSTLVIAALTSVITATVVSRLWAPGTVWATAMTPVIIAVVREMLERPARRVSSVASRYYPSPVAKTARTVAEPPPEAHAPPPPVPGAEYSKMRVYRRERAIPGRRWKLAIATGLLAAVIAIAAMTLPELVAGRSIVSSSNDTTIFGGHRNTHRSPSRSTTTDNSTNTEQKNTTTAPETTTTAPPETQQRTETQPPAQTEPQPAPEAQPQTQPPAQPQPQQEQPQQTTPAPTP